MEEQKLERKNSHDWTSCCGSRIDKRLLEYVTKSLVIISVLFYAMLAARQSSNETERNIYINICVMILSVFLPSPSIKPNNDT